MAYLLQEKRKLEDAVDWFAKLMKEKLIEEYEDGRKGWDDPKFVDSGKPLVAILEHIKKAKAGFPKQLINVANYAMIMAYRYKRQINFKDPNQKEE
jgi:hypothetical protein